MSRQKAAPPPTVAVISTDERSHERQIAQIRTRLDTIRRGFEIEYPIQQKLRKKLRHCVDWNEDLEEVRNEFDNDYRRAIIEELEWVLREVFEVTP